MRQEAIRKKNFGNRGLACEWLTAALYAYVCEDEKRLANNHGEGKLSRAEGECLMLGNHGPLTTPTYIIIKTWFYFHYHGAICINFRESNARRKTCWKMLHSCSLRKGDIKNIVKNITVDWAFLSASQWPIHFPLVVSFFKPSPLPPYIASTLKRQYTDICQTLKKDYCFVAFGILVSVFFFSLKISINSNMKEFFNLIVRPQRAFWNNNKTKRQFFWGEIDMSVNAFRKWIKIDHVPIKH